MPQMRRCPYGAMSLATYMLSMMGLIYNGVMISVTSFNDSTLFYYCFAYLLTSAYIGYLALEGLRRLLFDPQLDDDENWRLTSCLGRLTWSVVWMSTVMSWYAAMGWGWYLVITLLVDGFPDSDDMSSEIQWKIYLGVNLSLVSVTQSTMTFVAYRDRVTHEEAFEAFLNSNGEQHNIHHTLGDSRFGRRHSYVESLREEEGEAPSYSDYEEYV